MLALTPLHELTALSTYNISWIGSVGALCLSPLLIALIRQLFLVIERIPLMQINVEGMSIKLISILASIVLLVGISSGMLSIIVIAITKI